MTYHPDHEPSVRELTPPELRGPAPRRARSDAPPELTACAQCGGPIYGASYGGTCEGCAAVNGDQDALIERVLEAPRTDPEEWERIRIAVELRAADPELRLEPAVELARELHAEGERVEERAELSRDETFALVRAAEDRGLALTARVAVLGRLIVHANPTTAASAGHALNVLKRDGRVPSCFAPTGELSRSVRRYLADAGHELPPDPVELYDALERVEEAERRPYPPHALNYLRPTSPVWSCPRCGGPTRSADAPTCADRHPRETMELVEPGEPGGELVRASDIEHARQLAASAEQGFLYLTGLQLDAVRRLVELWRRVREGWDGPPPPLPRETPGLRVHAGRSYLTPELEHELPELIALAERVRRSS